MKKIETWLPVFSGFYGTIWESDDLETNEIEYINEQRKEKNLPPVEWDDVEFDFQGYFLDVSKEVTKSIDYELQKDGFVTKLSFQELRQPREYNFANDSVDIVVWLKKENEDKIRRYLCENLSAFKEYLKERYTSRSGFFSSYSPNVDDWKDMREVLTHQHKLGAILNFILLNENKDLEMDIYEHYRENGLAIQIKNYEKLIKGTPTKEVTK